MQARRLRYDSGHANLQLERQGTPAGLTHCRRAQKVTQVARLHLAPPITLGRRGAPHYEGVFLTDDGIVERARQLKLDRRKRLMKPERIMLLHSFQTHHVSLLLLLTAVEGFIPKAGASDKPRVIISTDIGGGDPDDHQSMVHYLVYADRFDTEGLISSPPKEGRLSDIMDCLDAYETDFPNLSTWSRDYPSPNALRALSRQGALVSQVGDAPDVEISPGAQLIVERASIEDPRPLYVLVWGALTDVAQAIHAAPEIKESLRVYSIGSWNTRNGQRERDYLYTHHPDLWWVESDTTFRGMYMGGEQDGDWGNRAFPEKHVNDHGALGELFMRKKPDIKMGDSPSVLYLLHGDPDTPNSPHWGGAFIQPEPETRPHYWTDNKDPRLIENDRPGAKTVNRWRVDYLSDWKDRMDRTTKRRPIL